MRNDSGLHARNARTGRSSSFFPTSLRAISSYLRNVSANASNIASTVRSAGASAATTISPLEDDRQREQVQWSGFDSLELGPTENRRVLLLTYQNGFQVWDVEEAHNVRELVSRRDGPVGLLRVLPRPCIQEPSNKGLGTSWPLLLVVTGDSTNCGNNAALGGNTGYSGAGGSSASTGDNHFVPTVVRFYSLSSHMYMNALRFRTAIYAVRCSPRIMVVALATQIHCFDAATLQNTFTVLTYPSPQAGPVGPNIGYGALAVGPRWLAYAANQPLSSNTGRVSPQHLSPSPGVSPSTSPANGSLVAHYAKESSKHIAAGIVSLGDMGFKTLSRYCSELLPDGAGSPGSVSPSWKTNSNGLGHSHEPEHVGTVIVLDFVSKMVIAQFRAHTSPLSALCFDPSGTLLATASVNGHNLNIFRLTPSCGSGMNSAGFDANTSHVHLYKLCRGITNAVIQDISFSYDSHWIAVSSSRGTTHLFAISPFGGNIGPNTHRTVPVDGAPGTVVPMPAFPWWSSCGPFKCSQQAFLPPPPLVTLSVVSRIKNGTGGWRGTVSGAAAAATGRMGSSSGAVAVVFHDGGGRSLDVEAGRSCLKEQLWVFSQSGHLIRYALHPSAGVEGVSCNDGNTGMGVKGPCGPTGTQDLRLVVEPLQKWDVCRKQNWVEREEKLATLVNPSAIQDKLKVTGTVKYLNGTCIVGTSGSGRLAKEGMTLEEMHQWFLSNAEVQMHQAKRPIWAKTEISVHVFSGASIEDFSEKFGGEIEVEKVLTRVVEVRKKDLVPVFEGLHNLKGMQVARDLAIDGSPSPSSLHISLFREDCMQGFIGSSINNSQMRRSSSGSSCGSETGSLNSPNIGLNGFHHAYQESQDTHTMGTTSSCEKSISYLHQVQPILKYSEGKMLQIDHLPKTESSKLKLSLQTPVAVVIGSPPMDIPQQGQQLYVAEQRFMDRTMENGQASVEGLQSRVTFPSNATGEVHKIKAENGNNILFTGGQRFQGVGASKHSYVKGGDLDNPVSSDDSSQNGWKESIICQNTLPGVQLHPHDSSDQESPGRAAVLYSYEQNHPQEYDAAAEDVESTDANSKSEDFEGGEQGEDAWEGAMFPFAEDG